MGLSRASQDETQEKAAERNHLKIKMENHEKKETVFVDDKP
jgi:hypothetical protein